VKRNSDIRNMFGGTFGRVAPINALFKDQRVSKVSHFVQWVTAEPVTVRSISLVALYDKRGGQRRFSRFRLSAKNLESGEFQPVYELSPFAHYGSTSGPGVDARTEGTRLVIRTNVPVTRSREHASFERSSGKAIVTFDIRWGRASGNLTVSRQ